MTREEKGGKTAKSGPGRPEGTANRRYDVVEGRLTACKKCGSTERSPYQGSPEELRQEFSDGVVVTTWHKCVCLACGQHRKDKYLRRGPVS